MVELLNKNLYTVATSSRVLLPTGSDDPLVAGGPFYPSPGDTVTASFTWRSAGGNITGEAWFQKGSAVIAVPSTSPDVIDYRSATVGATATPQSLTLSVPGNYDGVDPYYLVILNNSSSQAMYTNTVTMQGPGRQAPKQPGGGDPDPEPGDGGDDGGDDGGEDGGNGNGSQSTIAEAAQRVADFLGQADLAFLALAQESVTVIIAMVHAYTRGRGFTRATSVGDLPKPNYELAAVITTASARLLANPEQILTDVGSVSTRGGFNGFSLAETFVLNRYRVRAQ